MVDLGYLADAGCEQLHGSLQAAMVEAECQHLGPRQRIGHYLLGLNHYLDQGYSNYWRSKYQTGKGRWAVLLERQQTEHCVVAPAHCAIASMDLPQTSTGPESSDGAQAQ